MESMTGGMCWQVLAAGGSVSYTVMFNTTATHGLPAALNAASNALLRSIRSPSSEKSISVANHPMPTLHDEAAVKFSKVAGAASDALSTRQTSASYCNLHASQLLTWLIVAQSPSSVAKAGHFSAVDTCNALSTCTA